MRTFTWRMGCVAIALATCAFYPRASFGLDCSYGGVFNPPLPSQSGYCVASGSLKTLGSWFIDASSWTFIGPPGLQLRVNEQPLQGFPFSLIPGSLTIGPGGVLGTLSPSMLDPIQITAVGAINNFGGAINIYAPNDTVTLRAGKGISLQGDPAVGFDPPSFFVADTIKLETSKGDIALNNNTVLVSIGDQADVTLAAPKGKITLTNTTIFVLKNGVQPFGICNFQAKTPANVIFGPNTNLGCIPNIKK